MAIDVETFKYEYINSGKKLVDFLRDKYIEEGKPDQEDFKAEYWKVCKEALLDPEFNEKFQKRQNSIDLESDIEISGEPELSNEDALQDIEEEVKEETSETIEETIDVQSIKDEYINSGKKLKDFINDQKNTIGFNEKFQEALSDPQFLREVVERESLRDLYDCGVGVHSEKFDSKVGKSMDMKYLTPSEMERDGDAGNESYGKFLDVLWKDIENVENDPKKINSVFSLKENYYYFSVFTEEHFNISKVEYFPIAILKAVIEDPTIANTISPEVINELVENDPVIAKLVEEEQSKINEADKAKAIGTVTNAVKTIKEYANGIKSNAEEMKKAYEALNLKGTPEDTIDIAQSLSSSSEKISEADLDKAQKASENFKKIDEYLNQKIADVEQEQKDSFKNAVSDKVDELIKKEELRKLDARINALKNTKVGFIENLFGKQKYIDAMRSNLYEKKLLMAKETKSEAITENPIESLINYTNKKRYDTRNA